MKEEAHLVLRQKIKKCINKGYIAPSQQRIKSLIKYFAVPKGIVDNIVQDWRIEFHAGANFFMMRCGLLLTPCYVLSTRRH
jgi:hypothetical protein